MDPTSGLFAGEGHIPLAATPHPSSAAPIDGATEMCDTVLDFSNTVTRIHEDPRVTLPYTDAAWATICDVGAEVDERLAAGDVRLTVGGEPTFVSIDNQVDDEWTVEADGPHKRQRAADLAARLKKVWAPNGLVQWGQGKWYPGEPLPRWQIALHWRADGQPLWRDEALLADPWSDDDRDMDPGAARRVLEEIAVGLGLPASQVRPAYDDPLSRLAAKVRLPAGDAVVPEDDLEDDSPAARAALLDRLDESVVDPAAYVLPLHRRDDDTGWASADWKLRRGRIVLLDGDSPAGLRLPLDAISWRPPRPSFEADPLARAARAGRRRIRRRHSRRRRHVARHRDGRRGPRRAAVCVPAAHRGARAFRGPGRPRRGRGDQDRLPAGDRGLRAAVRPAAAVDDDHPGPRRHRGQRRADRRIRRTKAATGDAVRAGAAGAAVHRVVRRRRHPRRHRRRQPHHARRHHAGRLAAAAPPRPAGVDADVLAAASVAVVPVRRPVRRHHVAGAAGRRRPRGGALRTRDRIRRDRPTDTQTAARGRG